MFQVLTFKVFSARLRRTGGTIYCCSDTEATDAHSSGLLFVLVKVPVIGSQPESFVTVAFSVWNHEAWQPIWTRHKSKRPIIQQTDVVLCPPTSLFCADADKYLIPFTHSLCNLFPRLGTLFHNVISTFHTVHSEPIMLISTISLQGYGDQIKYMHNTNSIEGLQGETKCLAVVSKVLYSKMYVSSWFNI